MMLPPWLWIGTPLKFFLWLGNRLATWTGSWMLWKQQRSKRRLIVGLVILNAVSFGILGAVFFWLHLHRGE